MLRSSFNSFYLETVMPNLVSLTYFNPRVMNKVQARVFSISRFLVKCIIKNFCHNSRNSTNIDMKLGSLSKLDKRNTMASKKWLWHHRGIYDVIVKSRNLNAWPITLTFSLVTNFYLTNDENRIKKSLT